MEIRTGIGTDVHQLSAGVPMHVAGLSFPDERVGLVGHSDGDVACHAICDALLSATGLGDIGSVFGTADPQWAGAAGADLVGHVVALIAGKRMDSPERRGAGYWSETAYGRSQGRGGGRPGTNRRGSGFRVGDDDRSLGVYRTW